MSGDKEAMQPKEEESKPAPEPESTNGAGSSSEKAIDVDDDIMEVSNGATNGSGDKKRAHDEENGNVAKKARYLSVTFLFLLRQWSVLIFLLNCQSW